MFGIKKRIKKIWQRSFGSPDLVNRSRIKELMSFFQADEYGHRANTQQADLGYGWLHYSLVRLHKPQNILCVGSRYGYIPAVLAQACRDNGFGHVYFVDAGYGDDDDAHWTGVGYWRTKEGQQSFAKFGLQQYISLFVMTTKAFSSKYSTTSFDYIYIDGDHSYKGVKYDFKVFWPTLREGGFLGLHDICVKETKEEGVYGVAKLWGELKKKHHCFEFAFLGSGLGIVQKC